LLRPDQGEDVLAWERAAKTNPVKWDEPRSHQTERESCGSQSCESRLSVARS
jgi:hypothetical protein